MTSLKNSRSLRTLFAIVALSLSLVGCQGLQPKTPGELALKNHDFVGLWDAYNACQTGSNLQEIQKNLEILQLAPKPISLDDSPIPVPKFIKKLTSTRNSRLAVDPRAMAALLLHSSCRSCVSIGRLGHITSCLGIYCEPIPRTAICFLCFGGHSSHRRILFSPTSLALLS